MVNTRKAFRFVVASLALACIPLEIHADDTKAGQARLSDTRESDPPCQLVKNVEIELRPFRCAALYPTRARQRGIEGWAEVSFTINPDGLVSDVYVLDEHPPLYFEQSAVAMAQRFRFDPALLGGQTLKDARYFFMYLLD